MDVLNSENQPPNSASDVDNLQPQSPASMSGTSNAVNNDVIVLSRITVNYVIIAVVFMIIGVIIGSTLFGQGVVIGGDGSNSAVIGTVVAAAINDAGLVRATATPGPVNVSLDDDPALGPEDAPVTIVEFSDFQCPFCTRFYQETYQRVLDTYEGQIRFVYRDFPLTQIHPEAFQAAMAAECADDQGRFWDYHDILFQNYQALFREDLISYAGQIGMDVAAFTSCFDSSTHEQEVVNDLRDGTNYGVRGTPAFYINGILVSGAQPFEVFAQVIDAELAKAGSTD